MSSDEHLKRDTSSISLASCSRLVASASNTRTMVNGARLDGTVQRLHYMKKMWYCSIISFTWCISCAKLPWGTFIKLKVKCLICRESINLTQTTWWWLTEHKDLSLVSQQHPGNNDGRVRRGPCEAALYNSEKQKEVEVLSIICAKLPWRSFIRQYMQCVMCNCWWKVMC